MNDIQIQSYLNIYKEGLLNDTLPFWLPRSVDEEHGGFMMARDQDGSLLDTDKGMWQQGRFTWLLATLYNEVESREAWLSYAKHGIDFIRKHGFDSDGRMFFHVDRLGQPIRKRRYVFTETFAAIAFAAYAKAAGDEQAKEDALQLFELCRSYWETPGLIPPKFESTRPSKGLGVPMIMMVTAQELRKVADNPDYFTEQVDTYINEIKEDFMHPELETVLETVSPEGEFMDHFDGRMLNPGHAIEAAWFIMQEARYRNDDSKLIKLGTTILDWMWKIGWDDEFGGIIYFRDIKGLPVQEYWHDMKFWWPQNEAIIATLMAYQLTGDEKYAGWHKQIHDWAYKHFPDPEYGEWFGYLHRDGRISSTIKGNLWKGPFHMPRMQLVCWKILEEMQVS